MQKREIGVILNLESLQTLQKRNFMENEKKKLKTMIISMSIILCMFIFAGIVLTFVLKSKQSDLSSLNKQNAQLEQDYNKTKEQSDYHFDPETGEYTDEYKNDHAKYDNNYGNDGDKIIEITNPEE